MRPILATLITAGILCFTTSAFSADAPITTNKDYIISASRYLNVQKEGALRVNKVMAGLKAQEMTGAFFIKTVQEALAETNEDWDKNYSVTGAVSPPATYAEIDRNIQQSHELRQAAYKDWLDNPADQDPVSAVTANESFKTSLELEQKALSDLVDLLASQNSMKM